MKYIMFLVAFVLGQDIIGWPQDLPEPSDNTGERLVETLLENGYPFAQVQKKEKTIVVKSGEKWIFGGYRLPSDIPIDLSILRRHLGWEENSFWKESSWKSRAVIWERFPLLSLRGKVTLLKDPLRNIVYGWVPVKYKSQNEVNLSLSAQREGGVAGVFEAHFPNWNQKLASLDASFYKKEEETKAELLLSYPYWFDSPFSTKASGLLWNEDSTWSQRKVEGAAGIKMNSLSVFWGVEYDLQKDSVTRESWWQKFELSQEWNTSASWIKAKGILGWKKDVTKTLAKLRYQRIGDGLEATLEAARVWPYLPWSRSIAWPVGGSESFRGLTLHSLWLSAYSTLQSRYVWRFQDVDLYVFADHLLYSKKDLYFKPTYSNANGIGFSWDETSWKIKIELSIRSKIEESLLFVKLIHLI